MDAHPFDVELSTIEEVIKEERGEFNKQKTDDEWDDDGKDGDAQDDSMDIDMLPDVAKILRGVCDSAKQKLEKYKLAAKHIVHSNSELVSETCTQPELIRKLKDSAAGQFRGDPTKKIHRGILFDSKVTGQCSSNPHLRNPPLRGNGTHVQCLVKLVVETTDSELHPSDLYFFFDGSKSGNHDKLSSGLTNSSGELLAKKRHVIRVVYEEGSCTEHLDKVRGFSTIEQMEGVVVVSFDVLQLHGKKRLHSSGTNRGNIIGPLTWPSDTTAWKLTKDTKKKLLGKNGVILVGGHMPIAEEQAPKTKTTKDTLEPVFYHATPCAAYAELIHGCDLGAGIVLACGDGACIMEFLRRRRPCFGFALTPEHIELLHTYLERMVFDDMKDEKSLLYDAAFAEFMDSFEVEDSDTEKKTLDEGTKTAKGKAAVPKVGSPQPEPPKKKQKTTEKQYTKDELLAKIAVLRGDGGNGKSKKQAGQKKEEEEEDSDEDSKSAGK